MDLFERVRNAVKRQFDDDSIDRLNYFYTPMLLVIFALTLSAKQYVGQPIQCWIPAEFTEAWEQYSENYCFAQSTYFIPIDQPIPGNLVERDEKEIGYYQWVPFFLGLQALLFCIPAVMWRLFNWHSGLSVKSLVLMSREDTSNLDAHLSSIEVVASHMYNSLRMSERMQYNSWTPFVHNGSYLTGLYLIIKVLYLVQVAFQFLILNQFLSTKYTFWGFGILMDVLNGREWEESGHFPRVTMCDFEVRVLGNKHRHSVQCVLMINMFNEKVYLFLWWWLLAVAVATVISLVSWFLTMSNEKSKKEFVANYLDAADLLDNKDIATERSLTAFVNRSLRSDGVFACKLISINTGDLIVTDLMAALWRRFLEDQQNKGTSAPLDMPDAGIVEDLKQPLH